MLQAAADNRLWSRVFVNDCITYCELFFVPQVSGLVKQQGCLACSICTSPSSAESGTNGWETHFSVALCLVRS